MIERKIRQEKVIRRNHFGFMPERSTIEVILVLRCFLHLVFNDLQAYNKVPCSIIRIALRLRVFEALWNMYDAITTSTGYQLG